MLGQVFSARIGQCLDAWVRACALPGRGRRIVWCGYPVLWLAAPSHGPCQELQPCNQDAIYCCRLRSRRAKVTRKAWSLGAVVTICAWRSECGHRRPTRGRFARLRDHLLAERYSAEINQCVRPAWRYYLLFWQPRCSTRVLGVLARGVLGLFT